MATQQPIFFVTNNNSHATNTEYIAPNNRYATWNSNDQSRLNTVPTDGKFVKMNIQINTDPGTGNNYKFSLYVNGVASTSLTITIAGGDSLIASVTADQTISAGDTISIEAIPTSTPTIFSRIDGNIIWEPTIDDEYLILGSAPNNLAPNATEYNSMESSADSTAWGGTENNRRQIMPASGTLKKLHCVLASTPGASDSYTMTLRVNNASPGSGPTVTLDNADFDKIDTTNTASISAGDTMTLQATGTSAANAVACSYSCVFVPTTAGEIPLIGGSDNNMSQTLTEFNVFGAELTWTGTRNSREIEMIGEEITLKALYVKLNNSPGSGTNYNFDVVKAGIVQSGLNTNIADTATTDNATGQSIDFAAGTLLAWRVVPTSTPTSRDAFWGLVFTFGEDGGGGLFANILGNGYIQG